MKIFDSMGHLLQTVESPPYRLRSLVWSRQGDRVAFSRSLPKKNAMRQTGHGALRVAAGPFPSAKRATREAWSLEISGFYSDVQKLGGGWYAVVGQKLNREEAEGLLGELERDRFAAHLLKETEGSAL